MTQSSRRNFLKTSAVGAVAVSSANALAQSIQTSKQAITQVEVLIAQRDADSTANWNDGLAHSAPYKNPFAQGKERGLVLGGGGTPLIAWYVGYFNALKKVA